MDTVNKHKDLNAFHQFEAVKISNNTSARVALATFQPFVGRPLNLYQMKNIFICYASEDMAYKDKLITFLHNPISKGQIKVWHDGLLNTGSEWDNTIKENLRKADIVIVLVSQSSINSGYINDEEMRITIERYQKGEVKLYPILVRPSDFSDWDIFPKEGIDEANKLFQNHKEGDNGVNMGKFQFFPKINGRLTPFSKLSANDQEEQWVEFKKELMKGDND